MFFTMLPFHGASARGGQRRRTFWVAPEPLAIRQCEFGFKDRCLPIAYQTIWFHAGKYKGSKEDAECSAGIARDWPVVGHDPERDRMQPRDDRQEGEGPGLIGVLHA
jgi:hypothetical protein